VIELGTKYKITGRGRVAREGLNCTLTGSPDNIREFCYALREWDSVFDETDFKITDGIPVDKMFKSLSIRKTNELVAYGLVGEKAPSLKQFGGTHLEADQYHKAMKDPEAVIIDVRNAYESAIGHFQPPESGAKLIDPKMRNSIEFPKWLNSQETKKQLEGKKVLMYCTGGIRCERATALLNQMSAVSDDLNLKGVYHCRGGIERYVKTYAEGGYWTGKNYLFDKRMEQTPHIKKTEAVENDVDSKCCLCRNKWTVYRGQFKCSSTLCGVPVIVCDSCARTATVKPQSLKCELCQKGYRAPTETPDLVGMKRKADKLLVLGSSNESENASKRPKTYYCDRVFLSRLPLTSTFTKVKEAIGPELISLKWLTDKTSGGFYGSAIALLSSPETTQEVIKKRIKVDKKKTKVAQVFMKDDTDMFDKLFEQTEFPPIGT